LQEKICLLRKICCLWDPNKLFQVLFFHIKIIANSLFSFLPSHWKRIPRYLLFEIKPKQSSIFFIFCQITYSHSHIQFFTFSLGISVYLARFRYSLVSMLGGYIIISCRKFQEALGIFRWYWWVFRLCSHEGMHLHLVVLSMHCVPEILRHIFKKLMNFFAGCKLSQTQSHVHARRRKDGYISHVIKCMIEVY